jgi:hypothetical protein
MTMRGLEGLVCWPGSTRAVSLVRICWALLIWTEFGSTFRLFESVQSLPKLLLSLVVWVGSSAMLVGLSSRLACAITGAALLASFLVLGELGGDDHFRRHQVYTIAIGSALLALTPCGGSFSLDRWRQVQEARRQGQPPPPETDDLWAVQLLQLQVAAMYLWAAYDKSWWGFHERMEMYVSVLYFGTEHPGPWFTVAMAIAGYGAVLLEYMLPLALLLPRTRAAALTAAIAFHAVIYWTLSVASYTCVMFALLLLFVDPRTVHRAVSDLVRET